MIIKPNQTSKFAFGCCIVFFMLAVGRAHSWTEPDLTNEIDAAQISAQLYGQGDLEGAIQILQRAVHVQTNNPQLHFMLANALFRQQDWNGAIHHYRKAVQLRPRHPDTHLGLGYACYRAGRLKEAVAAWRTAVRQSPADALPYLSLAVGLSAQGRISEAHHYTARALALDSGWQQRIAIDVRWTRDMVRAVGDLVEAVERRAGAAPAGG